MIKYTRWWSDNHHTSTSHRSAWQCLMLGRLLATRPSSNTSVLLNWVGIRTMSCETYHPKPNALDDINKAFYPHFQSSNWYFCYQPSEKSAENKISAKVHAPYIWLNYTTAVYCRRHVSTIFWSRSHLFWPSFQA